MKETFFTLQDFLLHTETITYILIGLSLPLILGFWIFLTGRDEDN